MITILTICQGDMSAKFGKQQTNAGDIQTLEANKHSENWLWKNKPTRQSRQAIMLVLLIKSKWSTQCDWLDIEQVRQGYTRKN